MLLFLIGIALGAPLVNEAAKAPASEVAPNLTCPDSVGVLALPEHIKPDDPRLNSKHLVVVLKGARRVLRMSNGRILHRNSQAACWRAGLGFAPAGHKKIEGDGKTPEGFYRSSDKPTSSFYAAIAVHYPNTRDANAAAQDGRIDESTRSQIASANKASKKPPQKTAMGGEILIHGGGGATDWTLGCIALKDSDIDALRRTLPVGMITDVLILP